MRNLISFAWYIDLNSVFLPNKWPIKWLIKNLMFGFSYLIKTESGTENNKYMYLKSQRPD